MSVTQLSSHHNAEKQFNAPEVDVIAIHGAYEGALETWTHLETNILWLRDLFPHQQLKARILAYGYKAETLASPGEGSADRILAHATSLVAELCAERQLANASQRPIIFVCHGLGGILVKRALVFSSTSRTKKVEHRRSIYVSTHAILFMGTPHNGIGKDSLLLPRKDEGAGPSQLMISLLKGSNMLQEINSQFVPIMEQFSIYYFWEQIETQAGNIKTYVVDEDSAAPAWDNVDRCGIMASHSGMVKFKSMVDPGYRVVVGALMRYIEAAPRLIESRWKNYLELLAEERQREVEALLQPQPQSSSFLSDNASLMDKNEFYMVPRSSSNYFTGREVHARFVKHTFALTQEQLTRHHHKVFVIFGLGGSGKTQFCLKYVEDNRSSYWGIFWIDASSEENAESGFAYLGQQAGKGATFAAGIHWLSNCSKSWLLVLDNADDPDMDLSRYLPGGKKGHILITTRNPEAVIHATVGEFRFHGMEPEEAVTLLLKSTHSPNKQESPNPRRRTLAHGIASELGYLPLALAHAGATIRRNIHTLERYLNYYLGQRKKMLSYPHVNDADGANIVTTWEIPFRRILTREAIEYKDAADLLHIFAFMHFESIPENLFQRSWTAIEATESAFANYPDILRNTPVWNEEAQARFRRAVRVLCDFSIIDHDADKGVCSLHPVVHAWARERLTQFEQNRWISCTAAVLTHCISPNLETSGRKLRRLLLPHIDSCSRALKAQFPSSLQSVERAAQLYKFASVYAENGLWEKAQMLQEQVVNSRMNKLGTRHEDTLEAQRSLGYTYWNLFNVESAIQVQLQVRSSRWWSRPSLAYWAIWPPWKPDHISYCVALDDLTLTLWLAGKRDLSKIAGKRAMEGLLKRLGADDPMTLSAMFNLARTYLHVREQKKGHDLLVTVVRKRKRFFGPDHPDTLMARNELGMSHRGLNRLAVAERLVKNVLESRKRILGDEHAYTLWSINDLSKIFCDRGRPEEAATMLEEIIPVVRQTLGDQHVGMFLTRSNLARAYVRSKRWNEAEEILRAQTDVMSSDHPEWIQAMSAYVHVEIQLGHFEEAERNCDKILNLIVTTKVLALDSPETLWIAEQLMKAYDAQERPDKILNLKKRVPAMNKKNKTGGPIFEFDSSFVRTAPERTRPKLVTPQESNEEPIDPVRKDRTPFVPHSAHISRRQLRGSKTF